MALLKRIFFLISIVLFLATPKAFGTETSTVKLAEKPAEKPTGSSAPIEISGGLDFYYIQSPQAQPPASGIGPQTMVGRAHDRNHAAMTLNLAEIPFKRRLNAVTFRADLGFGQMTDTLASATEPTRNILQATLNFAANEKVQLSIGKFYSYLGFETQKAKDNWQYSRNFGAFAASPV